MGLGRRGALKRLILERRCRRPVCFHSSVCMCVYGLFLSSSALFPVSIFLVSGVFFRMKR